VARFIRSTSAGVNFPTRRIAPQQPSGVRLGHGLAHARDLHGLRRRLDRFCGGNRIGSCDLKFRRALLS
jgi:hypothetical protein